MILRNHRPGAVDIIMLLNGLAGKIDSGGVKAEAFSIHQIWFGFSGKNQEEIDGITIYRTWIYAGNSRSIFKRLLNYFSFVFTSFFISLIDFIRLLRYLT